MRETLVALVATNPSWAILVPWLPAVLALLALCIAVVLRFGQTGHEAPTATLFTIELAQLGKHTRELKALQAEFETLSGESRKKDSKKLFFFQAVIERHLLWLQAASPLLSKTTGMGLEKRHLYLKSLLNDICSMTESKVSRNLESRLEEACEDAVSEAVRTTDQDLDMGDNRSALEALVRLVDAAGMQLIDPREGEVYRAGMGGVARRVGQVTTRGVANRNSRVIREPEFSEAL